MDEPTNKEMIEYFKECPQYKGRSELIKYLNGKRITPAQAIEAHCYECAYIGLGPVDCGITLCPLYPFAPYSDVKAPKRMVSDELRAKLRANALSRKKQTLEEVGSI